jgi:hypothetical protein
LLKLAFLQGLRPGRRKRDRLDGEWRYVFWSHYVESAFNNTHTTSVSVTNQIQISQNVQDTFTVPARTAFQADYGVYGYKIFMNLDVWEVSGGRCWYYPQYSPRNVWVDPLPTRAGGCKPTRVSTSAAL